MSKYKIEKLSDEQMRISGTHAWSDVWQVVDHDNDFGGEFVGFLVSKEHAEEIVKILGGTASEID